jgi:hypothetical protein
MKLIQAPSLITGVILGASLITLSAAGSNAAPGDLNVFVPGTVVSSTDVNANFTYVSNLVSYNTDNIASNSSRIDILENGSGYGNKFFLMDTVPRDLDNWSVIIEVPLGSNPIIVNSIRLKGSDYGITGDTSYAGIEKIDGSIIEWGSKNELWSGQQGSTTIEGWRGELLLNPGEKLLMKATNPVTWWQGIPYYINGEYVN